MTSALNMMPMRRNLITKRKQKQPCIKVKGLKCISYAFIFGVIILYLIQVRKVHDILSNETIDIISSELEKQGIGRTSNASPSFHIPHSIQRQTEYIQKGKNGIDRSDSNRKGMNDGMEAKAKTNEEKRSKKRKKEMTTTSQASIATGYNPSKMLYLNASDSSTLIKNQPTIDQSGDFNIDILTIGSISSIKRAHVQLQTWASHTSRRHFWLATEYDDPDPSCHTNMTLDQLDHICELCRKGGKRYWGPLKAYNHYTKYLRNGYAQKQWLLRRPNPTGWLCAQKRFLAALSKLMALYRNAKNQDGIDLPDYLIFGDDDTYINLEMFENQLLATPNKQVQEQKLTLDDELKMVYPTQNTPVVFAGCRVRRPTHIVNDTLPFGGFGVMISKAAIERFIHPLYCNGTVTATVFEKEACGHWTKKYKNAHVGEHQFFEPGMSISDLMGTYVHKVDPFCLHSDWAIGYFVNYFNISRHVVPTGHLHSNRDIYIYNDGSGAVEQARLHAWDDGSELYKREEGNCRNMNRKCNETSGVCHKMSERRFREVHGKVKTLFPDKYRKLRKIN